MNSSLNISFVIRGYMSVAGSFIGVTERDSADFAAAPAFLLPRIPT